MQTQAGLQSGVFLFLTLCLATATSTVASPVSAEEGPLASLNQTVMQIQRENVELQQENAAIKQDNTAIKQDMADMRRDNAALRQDLSQVQGMMLRYLDSRPIGCASTPDPPRNTSSGGATYVRWGRTSCPPETDLVYKGYTGGSRHSDSGAAAEHLCLPQDPQYASFAPVRDGARIFGAEYSAANSVHGNLNQDVPCAVCRSSTRSSAIMVPARTSCYPGFHREYDGYLMAGHWLHTAASEYVCVDKSPENVAGGASDREGTQFYFVETRCGSLKCPPYVEGRAMTCAVCSK